MAALVLALPLVMLPSADAADAVPRRVPVPAPDFPLPDALVDSASWDEDEFYETWLPRKVATRIANRIWPGRPEVFGLRPHAISARSTIYFS